VIDDEICTRMATRYLFQCVRKSLPSDIKTPPYRGAVVFDAEQTAKSNQTTLFRSSILGSRAAAGNAALSAVAQLLYLYPFLGQ
jgi:hypothetical protein